MILPIPKTPPKHLPPGRLPPKHARWDRISTTVSAPRATLGNVEQTASRAIRAALEHTTLMWDNPSARRAQWTPFQTWLAPTQKSIANLVPKGKRLQPLVPPVKTNVLIVQ